MAYEEDVIRKTPFDFVITKYIENEFRWALIKYRKLHPDKPLPHITPHVCRHMFCTNMAGAGMDPKVLQYIMGHSEIEVTMNVYTHMNYERASAQMFELVYGVPEPKKAGPAWAWA